MADAARETSARETSAREIWITGIGIVSCLGEGPEVHWRRLNEPPPLPEMQAYAPHMVHTLAPVEFDKQIPKKGDQRQMEAWQRIGTYAAGLALDSAGAKGKAELLARMDMIVAAGGGERDEKVDSAIMSGMPKAANPEAFLNEHLMSDLRPTLFLAQLSNLLAGNISIVHGVTGSSRTFMGEEQSGVDAVRIAHARIQAGQSDIALVGGAHNGERHDLLMLYGFGGHVLTDSFAPVWERARARARGQAAGAAFCRAVGSQQPPGRCHQGHPDAHVVHARAATIVGPHRRDLGRIGSRAGDVGGTRLPRHRPRGSGACDRHLCRPRL
jgi:3-oxoacyl-[acyl-carrier-protein] synthase II